MIHKTLYTTYYIENWSLSKTNPAKKKKKKRNKKKNHGKNSGAPEKWAVSPPLVVPVDQEKR